MAFVPWCFAGKVVRFAGWVTLISTVAFATFLFWGFVVKGAWLFCLSGESQAVSPPPLQVPDLKEWCELVSGAHANFDWFLWTPLFRFRDLSLLWWLAHSEQILWACALIARVWRLLTFSFLGDVSVFVKLAVGYVMLQLVLVFGTGALSVFDGACRLRALVPAKSRKLMLCITCLVRSVVELTVGVVAPGFVLANWYSHKRWASHWETILLLPTVKKSEDPGRRTPVREAIITDCPMEDVDKVPQCMVEVLKPNGNKAPIRIGWANFITDPDWANTFGTSEFFATAAHVVKKAMVDGQIMLRSPHNGCITQAFVPRLLLNAGKGPTRGPKGKGFDLVYFAVPGRTDKPGAARIPVGAMLAIKAAKPVKARKGLAARVFSPPECEGSQYRVATGSLEITGCGLGLAYRASTAYGASGSGIFQNGKYIGLHLQGQLRHPETHEEWNGGVVHLPNLMRMFEKPNESMSSDHSSVSAREDSAQRRADEDYSDTLTFAIRGYNEAYGPAEGWRMIREEGHIYMQRLGEAAYMEEIDEITAENLYWDTPGVNRGPYRARDLQEVRESAPDFLAGAPKVQGAPAMQVASDKPVLTEEAFHEATQPGRVAARVRAQEAALSPVQTEGFPTTQFSPGHEQNLTPQAAASFATKEDLQRLEALMASFMTQLATSCGQQLRVPPNLPPISEIGSTPSSSEVQSTPNPGTKSTKKRKAKKGAAVSSSSTAAESGEDDQSNPEPSPPESSSSASL